jgi:hypothetical protein
MKALVVTLALVASPMLAQSIVARTAGTPANMVSGGDIRLEVEAPAEGLRFTVNGQPQDVALIAAPVGVSGVVTPFTSEVLKCALRPVDAAEYRGKLDAAQVARVRAVFASGVCDWSKPGVGFAPATPWQRF